MDVITSIHVMWFTSKHNKDTNKQNQYRLISAVKFHYNSFYMGIYL